jgi:hypothetical protein
VAHKREENGDYVVDADEGCTVSVGHDGEGVGGDVRSFLYGFCFHVAVAGCSAWRYGAGRMLFSHSGLVMGRRRGAVVIIAPLARTALESSGEDVLDNGFYAGVAVGCCLVR